MTLIDLVLFDKKDYAKIISLDRFVNGTKIIIMTYHDYQFQKKPLRTYIDLQEKAPQRIVIETNKHICNQNKLE